MSVEFEPVRLGARRRRLDPIALAAVAVVVALAVSVAKPWGEAPAGGSQPVASNAPDASLSTPVMSATPTTARAERSAPGVVVQAPSEGGWRWPDILTVVEPRNRWGVRTILASAPSNGAPPAGAWLAEAWLPASPSDGEALPSLELDPGERSILALGVTFPPEHTPLDVRIWREGHDGLEWMDADAVDSVPSAGAFLYRPPTIPDGSPRRWPAGRYRLDLLVDGSVRRIAITIPDPSEAFVSGSRRPNLHDVRTALVPRDPSLPEVPFGLFGIVNRVAVPLPSEEGAALDEVAAWLNVDPGTQRAPRSFVASAYLPRAAVLGVMLEPRAVVTSAAIRRLAPEPLPADVPAVFHASLRGASEAGVTFAAPTGAWAPGVYRIDVEWAGFGGRHAKSWHVELLPGPRQRPSPLLAATRAWARYAGERGFVLGTAEPLEGGPRSSTIRLTRGSDSGGSGYPVRDRVACDGLRLEGLPGVFGVAQPLDAPRTRVVARVLFEYSRSGEQPILTAAGNVPGLDVVAAAGPTALTSEAHRVRIGEELTPTWSEVCVQVVRAD